MPKFFFTYGSDPGFPFQNGWTEIEAPTLTMACETFRHFHPDRHPGTMNCAFYYTEEQWRESINPTVKAPGNVCHERIKVSVDREVMR